MAARTRRKYSVYLKAKAALAAIVGDNILAEAREQRRVFSHADQAEPEGYLHVLEAKIGQRPL